MTFYYFFSFRPIPSEKETLWETLPGDFSVVQQVALDLPGRGLRCVGLLVQSKDQGLRVGRRRRFLGGWVGYPAAGGERKGIKSVFFFFFFFFFFFGLSKADVFLTLLFKSCRSSEHIWSLLLQVSSVSQSQNQQEDTTNTAARKPKRKTPNTRGKNTLFPKIHLFRDKNISFTCDSWDIYILCL